MVALVILLALLVVADRVAAAVASSRIAGEIETRLGLEHKPDVDVTGFPLLTQAVAGSYDKIVIDADDVPAEKVGKVDAHVELRDMRLGLSDVLSGDVSSAVAGDARADVRVPESSLSQLAGRPVKVESVTDDVARLSTTFDVFGTQLDVSIEAMVVVEGKNARLDVQGVTAAGVTLPGTVVSQISDAFGTAFEVPSIVEGMYLDSVAVEDGAIVLHARGKDVPLPTR